MKPHPRIRKTIKWTGAAVTALLMVVWIASGWAYLRFWPTPALCISVSRGQTQFTEYRAFRLPATSSGWKAGTHPFNLAWASRWDSDQHLRDFQVALWLPSVIAWGVTASAWLLDNAARRRARLNLCPKCNYDRTGLAKDSVCPECGAPAAHP
jgi:hypothetical protein